MSEFISKSSWSRTSRLIMAKFTSSRKIALLHALFEEVHCIFRAPVPIVLHQLISLGIFLDILKKPSCSWHENALCSTDNISTKLPIRYWKSLLLLSQKVSPSFWDFKIHSSNKVSLSGKIFVESALRDTQRCGNLIHRDTFIPFVVNNSTAARMIRSLSSTRDVECFVCSPIFLPFLN